MAEMIMTCPVCKGNLSISVLSCNNCGLSLQNQFQLNAFNYLPEDQMSYLLAFLRCQGNFKLLQQELNISYPLAKKKLFLLLQSLDLAIDETSNNILDEDEEIDMTNLTFNPELKSASDIIKQKLFESRGKITVTSARGYSYEIRAKADGKHFECDQLPIAPLYEYSVFDVMVECLLKNGGVARKGNGRNYKLGEPECDDTTLVGYIAQHYAGKADGSSVFDPVFVLVAVLEWAGIAYNKRGYVELTKSFRHR